MFVQSACITSGGLRASKVVKSNSSASALSLVDESALVFAIALENVLAQRQVHPRFPVVHPRAFQHPPGNDALRRARSYTLRLVDGARAGRGADALDACLIHGSDFLQLPRPW